MQRKKKQKHDSGKYTDSLNVRIFDLLGQMLCAKAVSFPIDHQRRMSRWPWRSVLYSFLLSVFSITAVLIYPCNLVYSQWTCLGYQLIETTGYEPVFKQLFIKLFPWNQCRHFLLYSLQSSLTIIRDQTNVDPIQFYLLSSVFFWTLFKAKLLRELLLNAGVIMTVPTSVRCSSDLLY